MMTLTTDPKEWLHRYEWAINRHFIAGTLADLSKVGRVVWSNQNGLMCVDWHSPTAALDMINELRGANPPHPILDDGRLGAIVAGRVNGQKRLV